jgi:putative DNA primase/helicase
MRSTYHSQTDLPIERVLQKLNHVIKGSRGWTARCPAHEDRRNSLSVGEGKEGRVLLRCHAGCDIRAIVEALGLQMRDLFPRGSGR